MSGSAADARRDAVWNAFRAELVGAFVLYRRRVQPFDNNQISLVTSFAGQGVIAIENTRLFEAEQASKRELQESLEYQTATSEVLNVISRSPTDARTGHAWSGRSARYQSGSADATGLRHGAAAGHEQRQNTADQAQRIPEEERSEDEDRREKAESQRNHAENDERYARVARLSGAIVHRREGDDRERKQGRKSELWRKASPGHDEKHRSHRQQGENPARERQEEGQEHRERRDDAASAVPEGCRAAVATMPASGIFLVIGGHVRRIRGRSVGRRVAGVLGGVVPASIMAVACGGDYDRHKDGPPEIAAHLDHGNVVKRLPR